VNALKFIILMRMEFVKNANKNAVHVIMGKHVINARKISLNKKIIVFALINLYNIKENVYKIVMINNIWI